ncbi:MAG: hypothetical protein JWQ23_3742, partial [Herminiimonas sp.]|nr:hypothetical protein [Herminiimonas sp.]
QIRPLAGHHTLLDDSLRVLAGSAHLLRKRLLRTVLDTEVRGR